MPTPSGECLPKRIAAVLLAAGSSTRFGGTKQLAKIGSGTTMIQRAVATPGKSMVGDIVVVVGNRSEEVGGRLGGDDGRVLVGFGPALVETVEVLLA